MQTEPKQMNVLALAFLGDSVYEVFVRTKVINAIKSGHADAMHRAAVKYVKASAQAKAVNEMIKSGFLTDDEVALARRARNHRTATKAKNADAVTYKWATAFEALVGYLDLTDKKRCECIMAEAARIIEGNC